MAEVIGDPTGVDIVNSVMALQEMGITPLVRWICGLEAQSWTNIFDLQGCPDATAFTAPTAPLPKSTSSSPPPVCFDVNGVMAMIPGNNLPSSALVWQLFLAEVRRDHRPLIVYVLVLILNHQPCPAGSTLPTPSNPGMCVDAEGTLLPIISNNMTAAAAAVKAIGFTSSTLSVVVSRGFFL